MVPNAAIMIIAPPSVSLHPLCGKNDSVFGQIVSDLKKMLRCYCLLICGVMKHAKTGSVSKLIIVLWYETICYMGSMVGTPKYAYCFCLVCLR